MISFQQALEDASNQILEAFGLNDSRMPPEIQKACQERARRIVKGIFITSMRSNVILDLADAAKDGARSFEITASNPFTGLFQRVESYQAKSERAFKKYEAAIKELK